MGDRRPFAFDPAGIQAFRRRYRKGLNLVVASDVRKAYSKTFGDCPVRFIGISALADLTPR